VRTCSATASRRAPASSAAGSSTTAASSRWPSRRRRGLQDLLRHGRERLDAEEQHVPQGGGDHPGGGELLDEEGVALGAPQHVLGEVGRRRLAEDAPELLHDLVTVEAGQLDPLHVAEPLELDQQAPQRVAPVDVLGPVGGEEEDTVGP
jgi:hypothetical protein